MSPSPTPAAVPSAWRRTPCDPRAFFSDDELARARRYQRPLARVRAARTIGTLVVLVVLVTTEAAPRLVGALGITGWVAQLVVVLVGLQVVLAALDVPLDAYVDLVHDRRWGLSTQTGRRLAVDEATSFVLTAVLSLAVAIPVYALVRATPWWWLAGWVVVAVGGAVFGFLFPVVVSPLFNRFSPLAGTGPDGVEQAERVRAIAGLAGVAVRDVLVVDASRRSRRDNAYVAGLGATRRVVLHDTLLEHPPELVDQVVAHELGHYRRHHVRSQLPVLAAAALVAFVALWGVAQWSALWDAVGVDGIGDPTGLPLVALVAQVVGAAVGLATAWVARGHERQADLEALELLGRPDDTEAMLRRLHVGNLADLDPGRVRRWWASHPPAAERMAYARAWAAGRPGTA